MNRPRHTRSVDRKVEAFIMKIAPLLLAVLFAACQPSPPTAPAELRVAAASDLQFALPEIAASFERDHPGVKVNLTLGSSGNLFAQIQNGAPFDIFLSADARYPDQLTADGFADRQSLLSYAEGTLVLWVPKSTPLPASLKDLAQPGFRKIAIANPAHAPYGAAAEAALRHDGVYDQLADKLVLGENIAQTAQFAQSGAAQAGLIALSLAQAKPMAEAGHFMEIPREDYPPLRQVGAVLTASKQQKRAGEFLLSLGQPAARAILQGYGFRLP
jgi:molybdate transport system substrate-binding protein